MSTTRKGADEATLWETGELGQSEDHVRVATAAEMAELDDALGLQMISIRLQKGLVSALKEIAEHHGIGYQPMIRDLLNRFAVSEIRTILHERLADLEKNQSKTPAMKPVDEFMSKIKAA